MKNVDFIKFQKYTGQRVRYVQPKADGHLAKIIVKGSHIRVWSKNDKLITEKVLSIAHLFDEITGIPSNSIVWGELHNPEIFASSVPTLLNDSDPRLQFTAFAAPIWNNMWAGDDILENVNLRLGDAGLNFPETIVHRPSTRFALADIELMLADATERKLEGWVLKETHLGGWYKLKPTHTVDAFVIGTKESKSASYLGCLQSVSIGVYMPDGSIHDLGSIGSGFDGDYKMSINTPEKREALLGKVCKVEYDAVAANGKLKFARLAKDDSYSENIWRTDKDADQCLIDQLEMPNKK